MKLLNPLMRCGKCSNCKRVKRIEKFYNRNLKDHPNFKKMLDEQMAFHRKLLICVEGVIKT